MDILRWDKPDPVTEMERMRTFLREHREFLDAYWSSEADYFCIETQIGYSWRTFAVRCGETAQFLSYMNARHGNVWFSEYGQQVPYGIFEVVDRDLILDSHFSES